MNHLGLRIVSEPYDIVGISHITMELYQESNDCYTRPEMAKGCRMKGVIIVDKVEILADEAWWELKEKSLKKKTQEIKNEIHS